MIQNEMETYDLETDLETGKIGALAYNGIRVAYL
jgi:hypothetical protein